MPYGVADKTVDVHLSWLRRKLGETAQQPRFLSRCGGSASSSWSPDRVRRQMLLTVAASTLVVLIVVPRARSPG